MPAGRRHALLFASFMLACASCGGEEEPSKHPAPSPAVSPNTQTFDEHVRERRRRYTVPRDQRVLAKRLIGRDHALAVLLGDIGYSVASIVPWSSGRPPAPVGVMATLRLTRPLTRREVRLPAADYDDEGTEYTDGEVHARINGARELTVLVGFDRGRLVSIEPEHGSTSLYPDSYTEPNSGR